jgi:hypothetical protein
VPAACWVEISIHNIVGEKAESFSEGVKEPGIYSVVCKAKNLSSGIYFYTISAKGMDGNKSFMKTLKMLLIK